MSKVAIVTDGVCDLSQAVIDTYGIVTIPYRIFFGDEVYRIWYNEKSTLSLHDFCAKLEKTTKENLPHTSVPSPAEFKEGFEEALKKSDSVIVVLITSKMSGSVQVAQNVINNFFPEKDITVFDSLQTMTGTGIQALEAAKMAHAGVSKDDILVKLEELRPKVRTIFAMNDLDYLQKQGRLGPQREKVREATSGPSTIIPVVHLEDGILKPLGAFKDQNDLIERLTAFGGKIIGRNETADVFLSHINQHQATEEIYSAMKQANGNGTQIHYNEAGSILGVYSGPKTICLTYIGDFNRNWLMS
ncbi:MAG: DegV family protein [Candidatus Heimdallarchaeota archaeon]|nr:DegV family protein [Candidatus Heimdallarchaeota archaeon]